VGALTSWVPLAIGALLAAGLTPVARRWLIRSNLVDLPGARRSHDVPTPRGGGVAVVIAIVLASLLAANGAWWPGLLVVSGLAVLGWADDRRELRAAFRLVVQVLLVGLGLWLVGPVESVAVLGRELTLAWLWTALAGVAMVWLINLHNFMDGSDGLAAAQGIWSGLVFGMLMLAGGLAAPGAFALALAGAFAGFLLWNRPPARIFMGDVGSMALGGGIAMLALIGAVSGVVSIWLSLIVTSLFVVDATLTLGLRVARGERWYTAHRQHAYQRLIVAGWSHGGVLGLYAAVNLLLVLPAAWIAIVFPLLEAAIAAVLVALLTAGWWVIQSATTMENQRHE
jgi:Fuc2NAc and GlcNAc transferase